MSLKVPASVRLYEDVIEGVQHGLGGKNIRRIRYEHIAQVFLKRSWFRSALVIESTGGHTFVARSMPTAHAEEALAAIEERIRVARGGRRG